MFQLLWLLSYALVFGGFNHLGIAFLLVATLVALVKAALWLLIVVVLVQAVLSWVAPNVAPLKTASREELASNRTKDLALCCVASLTGAPQVSVPIGADAFAIGLSFIAARGEDKRLLEFVAGLALAPA